MVSNYDGFFLATLGFGAFEVTLALLLKDAFGYTLTADNAANINDSETYGGRASLLFKPSDKFDVPKLEKRCAFCL